MHEEFKPGYILMSEFHGHARWLVMKKCQSDWGEVIAVLTHDQYGHELNHNRDDTWNIIQHRLIKVDSLDDQTTRTNQRVMQETHDYYSLLTELTMGE